MGEAKKYILHLFKISFIFPCFPQTSASTATDAKMAGNTDRTFIMVKPDGVQRGLVGDIIKRFEQRGFKLVAMKFMQGSKDISSSTTLISRTSHFTKVCVTSCPLVRWCRWFGKARTPLFCISRYFLFAFVPSV